MGQLEGSVKYLSESTIIKHISESMMTPIIEEQLILIDLSRHFSIKPKSLSNYSIVWIKPSFQARSLSLHGTGSTVSNRLQ